MYLCIESCVLASSVKIFKKLSSYKNILNSAPGSIILQMQKPHLCDKRQQVVVGLQLSDACAGGQCWEFYLIN